MTTHSTCQYADRTNYPRRPMEREELWLAWLQPAAVVLMIAYVTLLLCDSPVYGFQPMSALGRTVAAQRRPIIRSVNEALTRTAIDHDLLAVADQISFLPDGRFGGMVGWLTEPERGPREPHAHRFLERHARLFNLPETGACAQVRLIAETTGGGGTHLRYGLFCDEMPVRGGEAALHYDTEGRLIMISGSFPDLNSRQHNSVIDAEAAVALASRHIGLTRAREKAETTAQIDAVDGVGIPVWQIRIQADQPLGDWIVLVDRTNGAVLDVVNQMSFFTGRGNVYLRHPLAGDPTDVPLYNLLRRDLCGDFVQVYNGKGDEAMQEQGIHLYKPDDTHFAEVMAYYHVNRMHGFYKTLGVESMERSTMVTVHHWLKDNAFYSSKDRSISLGDGNLRNDYWCEESVIYHEYAHAVLDSICFLLNCRESGAMNEGQADYFAATIDGDPVIGEYVMARENQPWIRNLTDQVHYPEDIIDEVHHDGRIWGGALWDLRKKLGSIVTDRLVVASFHYLKNSEPTFTDGLQAILAADQALNRGFNVPTIRAVFARRGIPDGSRTGAVLDSQQLRQMMRFEEQQRFR